MDDPQQEPLRFKLLPALYRPTPTQGENDRTTANKDAQTDQTPKESRYKFPFRMAEHGSIKELQTTPDPSKALSLFQNTFKKFTKKRKNDGKPAASSSQKRRRQDNRAKVVAEWRLKKLIDFQREENNNTKMFLCQLKKTKRKSRVSKIQFAAKQEIQRKSVEASTTVAQSKERVEGGTSKGSSGGDSWYANMLEKLQAQEEVP